MAPKSRAKSRAEPFRRSARPAHRWGCPPRPARAVRCGRGNGFLQVVANAVRVVDGHRILRQRLHHGNNVKFLIADLPDTAVIPFAVIHAVGTLDLAADEQAGSRIKPCPGQSGDGVGSTRPGRDHCHAEMIGELGVVLSGNRRRLLVVVADELQARWQRASESFRCMAPPPTSRKTCLTPCSATKRTT